MVWVEGGEFLMGDIFGDGADNERPPHSVRLDPYYIGRCEVTLAEFQEFVEETGYVTSAESGSGALVFDESERKQVLKADASWRNPFHAQSSCHPVVCVSWYDAIAYCNWKSEHEGLNKCYVGEGGDVICDFDTDGYRLPTEAEWEYAARSGGKEHRYAWGNGQPFVNGRAAANIRDVSFRRRFPHARDVWPGGYEDGEVFTSPVGRYEPNELGIHDITGNVYEWCWDWKSDVYYAESPRDNPRGPETGSVRACRDVGFGCPIPSISNLSRGYAKPVYRAEHVGFRLARSAR
jgi:formylglycine-generating enzyme required for sulfatase activity